MGFDITSASAYINSISTKLSTKAVLGSQTFKLLVDSSNYQSGVKGSAAVTKMDNTVSFTDKKNCGRTANGVAALSDVEIKTAVIGDNLNLCPEVLYSTMFAKNLATGADTETELSNEFIGQIMEDRAAIIAAENEKALWIGDTTLTGVSNYKFIDGIIKQTTNSATVVTGATTVEKLQSFVLAVPVAVRQSADFRLFVGSDVYAEYLIDLFNKNIFNQNGNDVLAGTTIKFAVVDGLNGTSKIYGARLADLQGAQDGSNDAENAKIRYSVENDMVYMDFKFSIGIKIVRPEYVYFADLSAE